jgi:hypothetical protein
MIITTWLFRDGGEFGVGAKAEPFTKRVPNTLRWKVSVFCTRNKVLNQNSLTGLQVAIGLALELEINAHEDISNSLGCQQYPGNFALQQISANIAIEASFTGHIYAASRVLTDRRSQLCAPE